ncbi:MAG TPA: succinate dehydrogenase [bacterium]|jgi:succinate dehydrogenase / fumarate reductase cytochrome b subunit|nr:succinate dehydrogenase [bacterium]
MPFKALMQDRHYFLLKRLHSLAGVVPLAGFVIFHLYENSHSVAGQAAFNSTVENIRSQPYLYILELGLLSPLLFHALMGIWLARAAKHNVGRYPTAQNIGYTLQRCTGIILLLFITFHLYTTRFAGIPSDQMFQHLAGEFSRPLWALFYVLGILSAAYHLSNGLWGFSVSWGLVSGQKSMDLAWKACMGLGLAVALMGLNALAGFEGHGLDIFQHDKTQAPPALSSVPAAPAAPPQSQPLPTP